MFGGKTIRLSESLLKFDRSGGIYGEMDAINYLHFRENRKLAAHNAAITFVLYYIEAPMSLCKVKGVS